MRWQGLEAGRQPGEQPGTGGPDCARTMRCDACGVPADLAAHAARPLLGRDCGVKPLWLHKRNVCSAYQPAFATGLLQKLRAHARCGSRVHVIGG